MFVLLLLPLSYPFMVFATPFFYLFIYLFFCFLTFSVFFPWSSFLVYSAFHRSSYVSILVAPSSPLLLFHEPPTLHYYFLLVPCFSITPLSVVVVAPLFLISLSSYIAVISLTLGPLTSLLQHFSARLLHHLYSSCHGPLTCAGLVFHDPVYLHYFFMILSQLRI